MTIELKSPKKFRIVFGFTVGAVLIALYFAPFVQADFKGLIFFAALAVLMEFWEVQLPKLPRILVAETIYISALFLFPVQQVLALILAGAAVRAAYFLHLDLSDALRLGRRLLVFGASVPFFEAAGLHGAFSAFKDKPLLDQLREVAGQLTVFVGWVVAYSVAQFFLSQGEKMILRGTSKISINWPSFGRSVLFNLFLIAPLGLLMYILYQLEPRPFPYALFLLIPPLLVIYRSIKNYTESLDAAKATIEALAEAVDKRLAFTHSHSPKVSRLARSIAIALGLSDEEVELVERAARIHDLGKVGIADKILNKKETLTDEEFKIIKKHPEIGAKVASQLSLYEREVEIIRSHHERFDGAGYPQGLKGDKIPVGARIIALADAFEAMISERPYRKAYTVAEAISEIKAGSGTQYDPKVVDAFLKTIEKEQSVTSGQG